MTGLKRMPEHYSRIFLLSHMRAYTSLAGHILGSHPRINGYFEMHVSYDDARALDKQLEVFLQYETLKQDSRYLFDKLLHNDYRLNTALFGPDGLTVLVTLQEPEKAVKSIVDLFQNKAPEELYASPVEAGNYYVDRLKSLVGFCGTTRQPYYYYDAELLREAPRELLGKLTQWLDLDSPLKEDYQLFSQTGRSGKGDSSRRIRSGKIDRTRVDYSHIEVPEHVLARARETYVECRSAIIANAADSMRIPREPRGF
jgi:hypothetical protein